MTDLVARQRHSLELWRVSVASDNLAYRLAFNTMEQAWETIGDLMAPALREELVDERATTRWSALSRRCDETTARRADQRICERGEAGLMRVLDSQGSLQRSGEER